MNSTIQQLIQLNVELEGALRVILARQSSEAMAVAREKLDAITELFNTLQPEAVEEAEPASVETWPEKHESLVAEDAAEEPVAEAEEETPAPTEEPVSVAQPAVINRGDLLKSFTVNDKFLFIRELFAGSEADFRDTITLISSMQSLDEAAEYLYEDLQLDPEQPQVVDFMNIIANYFK